VKEHEIKQGVKVFFRSTNLGKFNPTYNENGDDYRQIENVAYVVICKPHRSLGYVNVIFYLSDGKTKERMISECAFLSSVNIGGGKT
jgi:hypothetical protein